MQEVGQTGFAITNAIPLALSSRGSGRRERAVPDPLLGHIEPSFAGGVCQRSGAGLVALSSGRRNGRRRAADGAC